MPARAALAVFPPKEEPFGVSSVAPRDSVPFVPVNAVSADDALRTERQAARWESA